MNLPLVQCHFAVKLGQFGLKLGQFGLKLGLMSCDTMCNIWVVNLLSLW